LASAISISSTVDRKKGHARYMARISSRSGSPVICSTPSHDGSSSRVCIHANCQGIARRVSRPPAGVRRAGRLPMCSASSSASGVAALKYRRKRGSSWTVRRNASRAAVEIRSMALRHRGATGEGCASVASRVAVV
jgi:hypothetical protein